MRRGPLRPWRPAEGWCLCSYRLEGLYPSGYPGLRRWMLACSRLDQGCIECLAAERRWAGPKSNRLYLIAILRILGPEIGLEQLRRSRFALGDGRPAKS